MNKENWKIIAERIEEFRIYKGWKKKEFAKYMGIHIANVAEYLRGELNPSNLYYALKEHGADMQYIMQGTRSTDERTITNDEKRLLEYFEQLGINTVDKAREYFTPENLALTLAQLIAEQKNNYKK